MADETPTDVKLSRTLLYNEHLSPPDNLATVPPTDDGYLSGETLIRTGAGWHWAPEPPEAQPGTQPEPVTFVPAPADSESEPKSEPTTTKASTKASSNKPQES
jgi:hypothetical protein